MDQMGQTRETAYRNKRMETEEKMSKKILIVSTSPRKGSNSEALALAFADGAKEAGHEVDFISLRGKTVNFCRGCFVCQKKLRCVIRDDADVIAIGTVALRWQAAFIPLHPLIIGTNMLMQSTRHIKAATFLSMNRNGVYFIPAILILPRVLGLFGVEITQLVADILSALTAIPYLIHMFRKLDRLSKEGN